MNTFAGLLILISTFMHAGWNLLARSQRAEHTFILRLLWITVLLGLAPSLVAEIALPALPATAWRAVLVSGALCGVYYFGLARAYGNGDFTVVYPVARALPIIVIGFADVLRGRFPSFWGWTGMILVAGACLVIPLDSVRRFSWKPYLNRTTGWVMLTATGTVGYTIIDKSAAEALYAGPVSAARYGYAFFSLAALVYWLCLKLFGRSDEKAATIGWQGPALAAVLNFGAYFLVLWAYQVTQRAGYVVALRQFSIVIGVVLAFVWFREKGGSLRLVATGIMLLGLLLIGFLG